VQSVVVCSDGSGISGQNYFQKINCLITKQQSVSIDSIVMISMICDDVIDQLVDADQKRRDKHTDQDITREGALGVDGFYTSLVEDQGQEGVMIKNHNSPCMLGEASRSKGY
jgi:hypothetical protein